MAGPGGGCERQEEKEVEGLSLSYTCIHVYTHVHTSTHLCTHPQLDSVSRGGRVPVGQPFIRGISSSLCPSGLGMGLLWTGGAWPPLVGFL